MHAPAGAAAAARMERPDRGLKSECPCLQGRIVEVKGEDDEARVIYDDDMEEWLSLAQERFQWLAPRAQSAGGTPELQVHIAGNTALPSCLTDITLRSVSQSCTHAASAL